MTTEHVSSTIAGQRLQELLSKEQQEQVVSPTVDVAVLADQLVERLDTTDVVVVQAESEVVSHIDEFSELTLAQAKALQETMTSGDLAALRRGPPKPMLNHELLAGKAKAVAKRRKANKVASKQRKKK